MGTEVRTALVTAPDARSAESMARALVEERLAACVNVIPGLVSVYRWEGEVQRDQEALMILKTTESRMAALRERVIQLHPYEVPEVLVLNVVDGHEAYLGWVREAVGDKHG
jgi:periplasmic divalent cation tolerance protein